MLINKIFDITAKLRIHKLFSPFYGGIGTILTLHHVIEKHTVDCLPSIRSSEVTASFLEYFINKTKDNYRFVSLNDVYEILTKQKKIKEKFISFTLDDGYIDNYEIAYPVFKKYNIPFCIFIATSFPDKKSNQWWLDLNDIIYKNKSIKLNYAGIQYRFVTQDIKNKEKAYNSLRSTILNLSPIEQDKFMVELFIQNKIKKTIDYNKTGILSWSNIKSLSRDPLVTIGAHTVNHYSMKQLTDDEIRYEINTAKKILENNINTEVCFFAYPYGGPDAIGTRELEVAKNTGFKLMLSTRRTNVFPKHKKYLYCLPRINIPSGEKQLYSRCEIWMSGMAPALKYRFKKMVIE